MNSLLFSIGALIISSFTASAQQDSFGQFSAYFVNGYKALRIPDLELSY